MFWNDLWSAIQPVLISAIISLLGILVGELVAFTARKLKELKDNIKSETAMKVVQWVEQTIKDAKGSIKFETASTKLSEILAQKNIEVSSEELAILIESAVNTFNATYWAEDEEPKVE